MDYRDNRQRWAESHQVVHFYAGQWCTFTPALTLRHTTACHLVLAGVDINTIRAWLGHSSIDTTNIYAEIDLEMKAKAMAICDIVEPGPIRPWKENKGLMAFLNSL